MMRDRWGVRSFVHRVGTPKAVLAGAVRLLLQRGGRGGIDSPPSRAPIMTES
jgi:hypothetical protein